MFQGKLVFILAYFFSIILNVKNSWHFLNADCSPFNKHYHKFGSWKYFLFHLEKKSPEKVGFMVLTAYLVYQIQNVCYLMQAQAKTISVIHYFYIGTK